MTTENCYCVLLFQQRYVQPQLICTEHFKFSEAIAVLFIALSSIIAVLFMIACHLFF